MRKTKFKAIVIGVSLGGAKALQMILSALPEKFPVPIIIVQHISPHSDNYFVIHLNGLCKIKVKEAQEKEKAEAGTVYISPPNYHLLMEEDGTFSLSIEGRVNYSRPSVDVLFESAAYAYGTGLIGIILTGANNDGSKGLKKIQEEGGLAIVQDPKTAEAESMPKAAIAATETDYIVPLEKISELMIELCK